MFKTLFAFLIGLMIYQTAAAQKKNDNDTLVYYLNKQNVIVKNKDSAAYMLFVYPRDINEKKVLYPIGQYYLNGRPKSIGTSSVHSPFLILEGPLIKIFPDGHRQSMMNFKGGKVSGTYIQNYANGKLYAVQEYDASKNTIKYVECRDSTGKILAEKGNGKWLELDENYKRPLRYTSVTNGVLNLKWQPVIDTAADAAYNKTGDAFSVSDIDIKPDFPGGINAFGQFLGKTIMFPVYERDNGISGRVITQFIVEKDGRLSNIHAVKGPDQALMDEAVRVLYLSPVWSPGLKDNKPVRVNYTVPISFSLGDENIGKDTSSKYLKIEKQPEFPGGLEAFSRFLLHTIQYPEIDREHYISGKVIVTFVVEIDGTLSEIHAVRGPSESLMKESVRVIRLSPTWKPGEHNGKLVRVSYTLPISFTLNIDHATISMEPLIINQFSNH